MTLFKPSFSTQQLLPPWVSKGSRNWAFAIKIGEGCAQDYLDTFMNSGGPDPAPWYWEAINGGRYGVLLVCDHCDFSSDRLGETGWDTLAHREVFWFFPAYRYARSADNLLEGPPVITWIQPFSLDDNSFVMFSSREIWGCEKDMATIDAYEGGPDVLHIDVAIEGCKVFTPRAISHQIGLMHICMTHSDKPFDWSDVFADPTLAQLIGDFLAGVLSLGHPEKAPEVPNRIEINSLKQFRDAFDLRYAAYRALIASSVTHTEIQQPQFFSGENVKIDFMWSDSFAERFRRLFGLTPPDPATALRGHPEGETFTGMAQSDWDMPRVRVPVAFATSFIADSRFEVLRTLHTFGQAG